MSSVVLDGLTVTYGRRARNRAVAVAPFSDEFRAGEWIGLLGPNGAGKSSLLRAIVGLVDHDGAIAIDGRPVGAMSDRERAALVAYVPQQPLIPDDMTARQYALLGRSPYIGYFGSETRRDRAIVGEVLARLELTDFADRLLGELSGGERQRVVLARALAQQAAVLLLDEPTSALDIGHQQQALELVTELRRHDELTVVSAMHDLTLAAAYTDRLTLLDGGHVVAAGDAIDVLTVERLAAVFGVAVTVAVETDTTGRTSVVVVPRRTAPR